MWRWLGDFLTADAVLLARLHRALLDLAALLAAPSEASALAPLLLRGQRQAMAALPRRLSPAGYAQLVAANFSADVSGAGAEEEAAGANAGDASADTDNAAGAGAFADFSDRDVGQLVQLCERAKALLRWLLARGAAGFPAVDRLRRGLRVLRAPQPSRAERAALLARLLAEPLALRAAAAAERGRDAATA